jgi:protein associated with RNAse G/E
VQGSPDILRGVDSVDVVLRKYDERPHRRTTTRRLGADEYGTWLGTPKGSIVTYSYGGKRPEATRHAAVRVVPPGRWWCAIFFAEPSGRDVYCDIIAPPRWESPTEVTLVDLDLDLVRYRPDGRVELEDEDEFRQNIEVFGYPSEVVAQATAAARELRTALATRVEPFGDHWRRWMDLLTRA